MTEQRVQTGIEKVDVPPEQWDNIFAPSSCLVIITTVDREGRVNAGSFGTCVRVHHDPVYMGFSVGLAGDTHRNVEETGEFTVNVVPFDEQILEKVIICGLPFKPRTNELERAGLTPLPAKTVRPPRIAECHSHLECKVEWTKVWADRMMVVGKVSAVSIDADCLGPDGFIIWEKVKPAHYCGARYKNGFVPANQPIRVPLVYEGHDEEFREGADWRTLFVPSET